MAYASQTNFSFKLLLAAVAAVGLAGCGEEPAKEYETDVVDESGGELIVDELNPDAVDVNLPETPMTPVPEEEAPAGE